MDEDEMLSQYAHIALFVDSTSVKVFCPNNSQFEEGKHYFDGKNRIYALKKEVVVMASPLHFALFSFPGALGARHDYSILKEHYSAYIPYLTKSAQETAMIQQAGVHCLTKVMLAQLKILLVRTAAECFQNRELAKLQLWAFLCKPYPYDHNKFDTDIDLLILLTNEHLLSAHPLAVDEHQYYHAQM